MKLGILWSWYEKNGKVFLSFQDFRCKYRISQKLMATGEPRWRSTSSKWLTNPAPLWTVGQRIWDGKIPDDNSPKFCTLRTNLRNRLCLPQPSCTFSAAPANSSFFVSLPESQTWLRFGNRSREDEALKVRREDYGTV